MAFDRISVDADQMGGAPCIRGLRIPVATVVAMIADGMTNDEVVEAIPDLEPEDIRQALQYAAESVREREIPLRQPLLRFLLDNNLSPAVEFIVRSELAD